MSATLANPAWNNSTVLKGDVLNEISTLKQHIDGDIVIAGSFQLVRTLITGIALFSVAVASSQIQGEPRPRVPEVPGPPPARGVVTVTP